MQKNRTLCRWTCCSGALLSLASAQAQMSPEGPTRLPEVAVSATGFEENTADVPATISTDGVDATNIGAGVATATVSSAGANTFVVNGTDMTLAGAMFSTFATVDIATSAASATTAANALEQAIVDLNVTLASLGSQGTALDAQQDFLAKLSDEIENGIGNLVDADLAKESAKLQSLQIKQQLGAQALSIANQAPQVILSLFGR